MNKDDIAGYSYQGNFEDYFENSLAGHVIAGSDGRIIRVNKKLAAWLGEGQAHFSGKTISDLLSIGSRIYFETHLSPLLKMQGFFDEVAVELQAVDDKKLDVLLNAYERKDDNGILESVRFTFFKASDRRQYEQNLRSAKTVAEEKLNSQLELAGLREQFIAILGHDLRNPLGSIIMGVEMLSASSLDEEQVAIVNILKRSASRIDEMIRNIMDFARARLGGGIITERHDISLEPVLRQVIDELQTIRPAQVFNISFELTGTVNCDGPRIAQMFSNLLANALTHGSQGTPILVAASQKEKVFELSVTNSGNPIPLADREKLFHPFNREGKRSSQNGLGLGLYIASEIARSHNGELTVSSTDERTCFTFRMKM